MRERGWMTGKACAVLKASLISLGALLIGSNGWSMDLAKVNGRTITDKDLQDALSGMNDGQRKNLLKDANSRRQVLSSIIDQEVLVGEAEKERLDQDAEFKQAAAAFRRQYLTNKLLQKNLGSKLTDGAAKKYYEAHKSKFSTDQVHAQHILAGDEKQASEMLKKVREPGADFQEIAEKNSRDPSAKNNRGDLGFFTRDRMVSEFAEAAFSARTGEIVGPVKTAYGYHIIKVIEKKTGKPLSFNEVELRVRDELRSQLTQSYVGSLRKQAKIHVDDANLEKL